jgi:hypothetical protein
MRAGEFIVEKKNAKMHQHHLAGLHNFRTNPDQNANLGKLGAIGHYNYGIALAGAGAGNTPDGHMPKDTYINGDPVFGAYTDVEKEMLDRAAKHMGDNSAKEWGGPSRETDDTHKTSPIKGFAGYPR